MEQSEFENALKDYIIKVVDKDNPEIVTFQLVRQPKKTTHVIKHGEVNEVKPKVVTKKQYHSKEIVTPLGTFPSGKEAATAHNVSVALVSYRVRSEDIKYKDWKYA